jgi:hypothetical protein
MVERSFGRCERGLGVMDKKPKCCANCTNCVYSKDYGVYQSCTNDNYLEMKWENVVSDMEIYGEDRCRYYEPTKKKSLELLFQQATVFKCDYVAVAIQVKGVDGIEIILIPKDNFQFKMNYYDRTYDKDMIMKTNKDIQMVGAVGLFGRCKVEDIEKEIRNNFSWRF